MINIVPKKVLINLIGNIANDQLVEIPENQLVGILAENKDFGGSNSSGKSNFTYAIPINLFGAGAVGVTNKDIKNDKLKGTPNITAYYDINGKELIVDRIIGGILSVNFDGEQIKGSNDDVQKKLNSIIGLTEQQFKQLAYKDQENAESFLTMKDSEKKDFLSSFFDTAFIDKMKENADLELKKIQQETAKYEVTKSVLNDDIGLLKSQLDQKDHELKLKSNLIKDEIKANNKSISEKTFAKAEIAAIDPNNNAAFIMKRTAGEMLVEEHDKVISATNVITAETEDAISIYKAGLLSIPEPTELLATLNQCSVFLEEFKSTERDIASLKVNLQVNSNNITRLTNSVTGVIKDCPTCKRPMDKAHLDAEIEKINNEIQQLTFQNNEITQGMSRLEQSLAPKDDLVELTAQTKNDISNYKENQSAQLNSDIQVAQNKIKESQLTIREVTFAKNQIQNEMTSLLNEIKSRQKTEIDVLDSDIKTLTSQNTNLTNSIKLLEESLVQYGQSIRDKEVTLNNLIKGNEANLKRIAILSHVSFITSKNGFVGHIFDSILDQLNSEIKSNLSMIPITRDFSVYFKPEKLVKSTGATNKDITFDFYDGDKEVSFSRVSGGQRLCVTLAVDEALDTVISQVLGIKVGFKVLDEQLHFVDNNSKEAVMEFLRAKSANKTYIIVDHSSELNASFESIIKVTRENGIATITNY